LQSGSRCCTKRSCPTWRERRPSCSKRTRIITRKVWFVMFIKRIRSSMRRHAIKLVFVQSCLAVVARTASRSVIYVVNCRFQISLQNSLANDFTRCLQWRDCDCYCNCFSALLNPCFRPSSLKVTQLQFAVNNRSFAF
jgi:hypothetical protein